MLFVLGEGQINHAALTEHNIEVQLLAQVLPQPEGELIKQRALVEQIIGTHHRGIARGIAASEPATLYHGDVTVAVLLSKIIGSGQAVPTAANDHDVVGTPWRCPSPSPRPEPMPAESIAHKGCEGIFHVPSIHHGQVDTFQGDVEQVLAPYDVAVVDRRHFLDNPLADARLVDLLKLVRQYQRLDPGLARTSAVSMWLPQTCR